MPMTICVSTQNANIIVLSEAKTVTSRTVYVLQNLSYHTVINRAYRCRLQLPTQELIHSHD